MHLAVQAFAGVAFAIVVGRWYINRSSLRAGFKKLPSPPAVPLFGHFWDIVGSKPTGVNFFFNGLLRKYGKLVHLSVIGQDLILVSDAAVVKQVLSNPAQFAREDKFQQATADIMPFAVSSCLIPNT